MVARWYWWRVNVYSEVSAMIASLVIGNVVSILLPDQTHADGAFATYFGHRFLINMVGSTVIWVGITLMVGNEPSEQAKVFFRKTGVGGPGWRRVADSTHTAMPPMGFGYLFLGWITGCVFILGLLLGVGEALFIRPIPAGLYIGVSVAAGVLLVIYFSGLFRNRDTGSGGVPSP